MKTTTLKLTIGIISVCVYFFSNVDWRPKTINITAKIVGIEQTTAKEIEKFLNETCRQMNDEFRQSDMVLSNETSDETERLFCRAISLAFKKFFTNFNYRTHLKLSTERRLIVDVLLFPASNSEGILVD